MVYMLAKLSYNILTHTEVVLFKTSYNTNYTLMYKSVFGILYIEADT